jgi:hypothetical protein
MLNIFINFLINKIHYYKTNFLNCSLFFSRTILEFRGQFFEKKIKFLILEDNFGIWRTISKFGGQFRYLADNFRIWRTMIFFSIFGGQFWKLADNCPRTIVVRGQLSAKLPRPAFFRTGSR